MVLGQWASAKRGGREREPGSPSHHSHAHTVCHHTGRLPATTTHHHSHPPTRCVGGAPAERCLRALRQRQPGLFVLPGLCQAEIYQRPGGCAGTGAGGGEGVGRGGAGQPALSRQSFARPKSKSAYEAVQATYRRGGAAKGNGMVSRQGAGCSCTRLLGFRVRRTSGGVRCA